MRLARRTVVVTGAGGGIGRAIALGFAAQGATVVLSDVTPDLDDAAEEIRKGSGQAIAVVADVTRSADMAALVDRATAESGRLDILVTAAGIDGPGLLSEQDEGAWTRVIDVNLNGTYRAVRAALRPMMAQRTGRIVTISSVFGRMGGSGYVTAYAASKHGVIGLTRALAVELGAQGYPGITVNAVCPGYVRAGMGIRTQQTPAGPMAGTEIFERYVKRRVPQRRMMEAEEIAHVVVFLALPESAAITGQSINVDGGFEMS